MNNQPRNSRISPRRLQGPARYRGYSNSVLKKSYYNLLLFKNRTTIDSSFCVAYYKEKYTEFTKLD